MVLLAGPDTLVHKYAVTDPSGSVPLPVSVTLFVGSVIVLSIFALAVGGVFVAVVYSNAPISGAVPL